MSKTHPPVPWKGFYAILDAGYVQDEHWVAKGRALLEGGSILLQVRAKDKSEDEVLKKVNQIAPLAREYGVPLIVNDHLEVALRVPEIGLHLGQEDISPEQARLALGPDRIIGLSTHSPQQVEAAIAIQETLSYFAVGPVFPTGTKPDYVPVGLDLVHYAMQSAPSIPFFCIGGIQRHNLHRVLAAGARGIVAVSDPLLDPDTATATRAYMESIERTNA